MSIYSLQKEDIAELLRRNLNDRDFACELWSIAESVDDERGNPDVEMVRVGKEETLEHAELKTIAEHLLEMTDGPEETIATWMSKWSKNSTYGDPLEWVMAILRRLPGYPLSGSEYKNAEEACTLLHTSFCQKG